ncbi:MAG: helix-turn-helix domain-containing protein [Polyangia bacterium]
MNAIIELLGENGVIARNFQESEFFDSYTLRPVNFMCSPLSGELPERIMKAAHTTDPAMNAQVAQQPLSGTGLSGGVDGDRAEISHVCDFVTVDELAAEIGVNRKTLYNFIKTGLLPGVRRILGRITIHRPTVIEWYRTGKGAVPRSRSKS